MTGLILPYGNHVPLIHPRAFVAPNATVIGDDMIARHDQQHRLRIARQRLMGGQGDRRRGVAPDRFEDQRARRQADFLELLGDLAGMGEIGDDHRRGEAARVAGAVRGCLQHGVFAGQRDELLAHYSPWNWCQPVREFLAVPERWQKWALYDMAPLNTWGTGAVTLLKVQREGKGPMESATFLRGFPVAPGTKVG